MIASAIQIYGSTMDRSISQSEINAISRADSLDDVSSVWGKIVDWFCGTHKEEAKEALFILMHQQHENGMPIEDSEKLIAFINLKKWVSPANKESFHYEMTDNNRLRLTIKGTGLNVEIERNTNIPALATPANSTNAVTSVRLDAVDEKKWQKIAHYFPADKQQQAKEQLSKLTTHQHQKGPWLEAFDALRNMAKAEHRYKFAEDRYSARFIIHNDETYLDNYVINIAPWYMENCSLGESHIPFNFEKTWRSIKCYFPEGKQEEAKKIASYLAVFSETSVSMEIYEEGFNQLRDMAKDDYKKCFVKRQHTPSHRDSSPEYIYFNIRNTFDSNVAIIGKRYWPETSIVLMSPSLINAIVGRESHDSEVLI